GGGGYESGAIVNFQELPSLIVAGSVRSGAGERSGSIRADRIGSIVIRGNLSGSAASPVQIIADGRPDAIQRETVYKPVFETRTKEVMVRVPTENCGFILEVQQLTYTVSHLVPESIEVRASPIFGNIESLTVE